jgi:hypothetical protein
MLYASYDICIDSRRPQSTREMIKKILDIISLTSLAVFFGVIIWLAIWGESPRAPGHLSIQSKIVVWNGAPFVFGGIWLLIRYANAAVERFPRVFGHLGLLFWFALFLAGYIHFERLFSFVSRVILPKLAGWTSF